MIGKVEPAVKKVAAEVVALDPSPSPKAPMLVQQDDVEMKHESFITYYYLCACRSVDDMAAAKPVSAPVPPLMALPASQPAPPFTSTPTVPQGPSTVMEIGKPASTPMPDGAFETTVATHTKRLDDCTAMSKKLEELLADLSGQKEKISELLRTIPTDFVTHTRSSPAGLLKRRDSASQQPPAS